MKKILAITLFAAVALSAGMDGAFAQAAGGPGGNGGKGGSSAGSSSSGAGGGALNAARLVRVTPCIAGTACNPPRRRHRVVKITDGCECTTQSIGVGRNISYVKNCYYYDPVADAQRYCAPWERTGS